MGNGPFIDDMLSRLQKGSTVFILSINTWINIYIYNYIYISVCVCVLIYTIYVYIYIIYIYIISYRFPTYKYTPHISLSIFGKDLDHQGSTKFIAPRRSTSPARWQSPSDEPHVLRGCPQQGWHPQGPDPGTGIFGNQTRKTPWEIVVFGIL